MLYSDPGMALQLYRRHTSKCTAKRPRWDRSYRRKGPIHAEGTLRGDGFIRRSTAETVWELAEEVKRSWENAGTIAEDRLSRDPLDGTERIMLYQVRIPGHVNNRSGAM